MNISILASGSGGNAAYLETSPDNGLLIDAGISCRDLQARLKHIGRGLSAIRAILVTHDHTDHCKGLPAILQRAPHARAFATEATARAVEQACETEELPWHIFDPAASFDVEGFFVRPVRLAHDAAESLGFVVEACGARVGVATDLGHAPQQLVASLAPCHNVVIEFNHDEQLLKNSGRPGHLIRRILSPRGHLSNDDAAELLERVAGPHTRRVFLAHLSGECNTAGLALAAAKNALAKIGRAGIEIVVTNQKQPTALFAC